METVLELISRWYYMLFGSSRLRPYEEVCLAAWRSTLSESILWKLDRQLGSFDFVERHVRRTKSVFHCVRDPEYKRWEDDILFSLRETDRKVFSGTLTGAIGDVIESVSFEIFVHRGRLFSIEFASEPGLLASLSDELSVRSSKTLFDLDPS